MKIPVFVTIAASLALAFAQPGAGLAEEDPYAAFGDPEAEAIDPEDPVLSAVELLQILPPAPVDDGDIPLPSAVADADSPLSLISVDSIALGAAAADQIHCYGANAGERPYDYPHPGASSDKKRINAHLSVRCTKPVVSIRVRSRMCHANLDACGAINTDTEIYYARTGGDLACGAKVRRFLAIGDVDITFPPGYTPQKAQRNVKSVTRAFRRNADGICVKAD